MIGKRRILADRCIITPSPADGENSGGRAIVTLFLSDGSHWDRVKSPAPDEAGFAKAGLPCIANRLPGATAFLVEAEGDCGIIPAIGGADEALARVCRQLEGGRWQNREEGEDEEFESHSGGKSVSPHCPLDNSQRL